MTNEPLRDPDPIRADCARKRSSIATSGMLRELLGYLVSENGATPVIEELRTSPDRCILGW